MATEATFTVASGDFPLGSVFEHLPGVMVELERLVPTSSGVIPYFWVRGAATDDIEAAFNNHPGVENIRFVDSVEDEYLLCAEWNPQFKGVLATLADAGISLVRATGTNREWTFEIRGEDRDEVAEFQRLCLERNIPITLTALHALTPVETGAESTLTEAQREVLLLAYERGYFNSPRDVTMEELGDELGISQQAVGSRLRRGLKRVVGRALSTSGRE